jgi:hypothetical protein
VRAVVSAVCADVLTSLRAEVLREQMGIASVTGPSVSTLKEEAFAMITRVVRQHQEASSWSERRKIALLLQRYVLHRICVMFAYKFIRYAALEAHVDKLPHSQRAEFVKELIDVARTVEVNHPRLVAP